MYILLLNAIAVSIKCRAMTLTKSSFNRLVTKKHGNDVWIVLFQTETDFLSKKILPKFNNISLSASGMFKFGIVDTKSQSLLSRELKIKTIPTIQIYHKNGNVTFNDDLSGLIDFASQFINDNIIEVNEKMVNEPKSPLAVLFTNKVETPLLWKGLSHVFQNKNVKIGICRNESLFKTLHIDKVPTILFVNKTHKLQYQDKINFLKIERSFQNFIDKTFIIEDKVKIYQLSEFEQICYSEDQICVINMNNIDEKSYKRIIQTYKIKQIKWFKGYDETKFKFLTDNSIWIYYSKKEGFINAKDNLHQIIQNINTPDLKWKHKRELMQNDEI